MTEIAAKQTDEKQVFVMKDIYDVVVCGGGAAGVFAGIAAARMGASTLIVEQDGYLGGTLTRSGIGPMATFHAGDKQIIRGLVDEFIQRLVEKGKSTGYVRDTSNYVSSLVNIDIESAKVELESMVLEAGGELLYHTMLGGVRTADGKIQEIEVCNKAGFSTIKAKVFVDATGDADVAYRAGVPCTKGRSSDGLCQPMGMKARYCNVDIDRLKDFIYNNPEQFPRMFKDISVLQEECCISTAIGFYGVWEEAKKNGEIDVPRNNVILCETATPGEVLINTTRLQGFDATNPEDVTRAEVEGRRQCAEIDAFLRKYVPGFETAHLMFTGPTVGTRSSRQIVGLYTMTEEDIIGQKHFDDEVCYSSFPIDIHSPDGQGTRNVMPTYPYVNYCGIPYRSMVSREIPNLIVAGRCLSATFEAQSALRTTGIVGAMGHAAGVAAVLAVREADGDARNIPVDHLLAKLVEQGAYLENYKR